MSRESINRGQKRTDSLGGRLTFEQSRNRIMGYDDNNNPRMQLLGDGTNFSFKIARDNKNVLTASPDELIMSSEFNLYKIIAFGELDIIPRDASITLDSNNVAYYCNAIIDLTQIFDDYALDDNVLVNVTVGEVDGGNDLAHNERKPFKSSGLYFDDQTNVVHHNFDWFVLDGRLVLSLRLRRTAGSFTFNPLSELLRHVWWEVCNPTQGNEPAGTGGYPGTGKNVYIDRIFYDASGAQTSAMDSFTFDSAHFWKYTPNIHYPNVYI